MVEWIIESSSEKDDETGESLYWSNELGWVDKESATRFSTGDIGNVYKPIGGLWVDVKRDNIVRQWEKELRDDMWTFWLYGPPMWFLGLALMVILIITVGISRG